MLTNDRSMFVVVNLTVSLFLLFRSYITLQVLDYQGLGLATLLQTLILLLGMMQFGVLNGGFRLICSAESGEARQINNFVYTFLGTLTSVGLICVAVFAAFGGDDSARLVAILGVVGGSATLLRTWTTSQMMAHLQFRRINQINLLSGGLSAATLLFIPLDPLIACLAAVVVQPVSFVVLALLWGRELLPTGWTLSHGLALVVLKAGFITFLTGLFTQANLQMERWYIVGELSLDALGRLYLVTIFLNLFQMIPTSLDQIFLPSMVRARKAGDEAAFGHQMRQAILVYLVYCGLTLVAVYTLAGPILGFILPRYTSDLYYIYIITPALLFMTATNPQALVFSVSLRFRYYFVAYAAGTLLTIAVLAAALATDRPLTIEAVVILRAVTYAIVGSGVLVGWWIVGREVPGARPRLLRLEP